MKSWLSRPLGAIRDDRERGSVANSWSGRDPGERLRLLA
jgi:hypothetical protein